jgi:hypothetical protein
MSKKKTFFKSKLEVNNLYIKAPMNFKCLLSSTERDFLEAVIHLQSLGRYNTSDSLIMANSGLNGRQITDAKRTLVALDLINIVIDRCRLGSRYIVKEETYNELVKHLNSIRSAIERFKVGDAYRESKGVKPIFKNIINTLSRRLTSTDVPSDERITVGPQQVNPPIEKVKERLRALLDEGKITPEEYHLKIKRLNNSKSLVNNNINKLNSENYGK